MTAKHSITKLLRASDDEIFLRLGEGLVHAYAPLGVACSAPYIELGKDFWRAVEFDLHKVLCQKSKPKAWTDQVLGGDEKELAVAIVTVLMAQFETTLAIAVPAAVLVVRRGLSHFCQRRLRRPKRSMRTILASWKRNWEQHKR